MYFGIITNAFTKSERQDLSCHWTHMIDESKYKLYNYSSLKKYWTNLAWELYNTVLIKYNDWMMKGIEAQFIAPQWLDVQKKLNIDIINDKRLYLNNTKCNQFRTGNKNVQKNDSIHCVAYLAVFQLTFYVIKCCQF